MLESLIELSKFKFLRLNSGESSYPLLMSELLLRMSAAVQFMPVNTAVSSLRAQAHQQDVCRNKSVAAPGCEANDRFKKELGRSQRMASSGSPRPPQSGRVSPDTWFLCTAISDIALFHLF